MSTVTCLVVLLRVLVGASVPGEFCGINKKTEPIRAFVPAPGFDRHDPSNIIRVGDCYWVFYTHNVDDHRAVAVHAASSGDGRTWEDHGLALGPGAPGAWDESGTIAPYVVPHAGRFYLFYTGFRGGDLSMRDLGVAVAEEPSGPWARWGDGPVLRRDPDPAAWDSGMLGDSNVLFREGRWWLYFKSRRDGETNLQTRVGVATAARSR